MDGSSAMRAADSKFSSSGAPSVSQRSIEELKMNEGEAERQQQEVLRAMECPDLGHESKREELANTLKKGHEDEEQLLQLKTQLQERKSLLSQPEWGAQRVLGQESDEEVNAQAAPVPKESSTVTIEDATVKKESAAVTKENDTISKKSANVTKESATATKENATVTKESATATEESNNYNLPVQIKPEESFATPVATATVDASSRKRKCYSGPAPRGTSLIPSIRLSKECCASSDPVNYDVAGNGASSNLETTPSERIKKHECTMQGITVIFTFMTGRHMLLRVKEDMSMGKIFETFAACNELPAKDLRFWLNGETIPLAETPRTLGLQDGAEIRVILRLTGGKPVILLYPPTQLEASVHLELSSDWSFSVLYPKPLLRGPPRSDDTLSTFQVRRSKEGSESETCVWRVRASPDGSLMDLETGKDYPYLFWEAQSKDGRLAQKFKLEETPSFCVPGVQAGEFLDDALTRLGLSVRERCDMITYWLPQLEAYPFNVIYFVDVQHYGQTAKLQIFPGPDVVIRVFMAFRGTNTYEAREVCAELSNLQAPAREGFVAVEWGGMNLNGGGLHQY